MSLSHIAGKIILFKENEYQRCILCGQKLNKIGIIFKEDTVVRFIRSDFKILDTKDYESISDLCGNILNLGDLDA